jgi:hypothetical protein
MWLNYFREVVIDRAANARIGLWPKSGQVMS